jgi:deoxyadenosine/deoxycytidine kinase
MNSLKIGVVGPCAAGKSTLISALRERGYQARHIAQEHSYVKDMWRRITNPDILIYLDVSYPLTLQRRRLSWSEIDYQVQLDRLQDARQNADLYLLTDLLSPEQVAERVLSYLAALKD